MRLYGTEFQVGGLQMNKENQQLICPGCLAELGESTVQCKKCALHCHKACADERVVTPVQDSELALRRFGKLSESFEGSNAQAESKKEEKAPAEEDIYWVCNRCVRDGQLLASFGVCIKSAVESAVHDRYFSPRAKMDNLKDDLSKFEKELYDIRKGHKRRLTTKWVYASLIVTIGVLTAVIVWFGWAQKPEITIQYDVGTIIGGILVGAGATIAGTAYALSRGGD